MEYEIITTGVDNVLMYSLLAKLFEHYIEKPKMQSYISHIYESTDKYTDFFKKLLDLNIQSKVLFSKSAEVFDIPQPYLPSESDINNYKAQILTYKSQILEDRLNPLSNLKTIKLE